MESQERESEGRAWNFKFSIFWEYFKFHWFGTIKLPIQNTNILISFKCFSKQIISLENFNFLLKMNHLVEMMYSNARLSISPYPFPPHYSLLLPFILLSLSLSLFIHSFIPFLFSPPIFTLCTHVVEGIFCVFVNIMKSWFHFFVFYGNTRELWFCYVIFFVA